MTALPIDSILPEILQTLAAAPGLVLQAPPGAGKTTRVPLALLDQDWLGGQRILMLEPRRLAARAAAARMAETLGQAVGETVGYRVRLDSKVGPATRIEVVTEGILTRMLQDDPSLPGIGLVIFDEFHERSLNADVGLALCLESQGALRDDLKLLVMSATLDGGPVAALMGGVPLVTSAGRAHPVQTRFLARPEPRRFVDAMVAAIGQALAEDDGDVLAFLPGSGEIRRVQAGLAGIDAQVSPLYGDLSQADQDRAIRPLGRGMRKVVLATSIAETSLTIDGVRVVVDGGLMRLPRFDPSSGMTRLVTVPVSRASADQRRGRAGRQAPGTCWRLWSEAEDRALAGFTAPEITEADLAPLALDLAQWGVRDVSTLAWLDPPPAAALAQARDLLGELGAVGENGAITAHGQAMNRLSMHPRLAHMVLRARDLAMAGLACDIAAILSERDVLRAERGARDGDIRLRLEALRGGDRLDPRHGLAADRGALARARQSAKDWRRRLGLRPGEQDGHMRDCGVLLAFAYPDRIAKRRPGGEPRYALSGGRGAFFQQHEPLAAEDWLVAAELDGDRREAKIFLAAPLTRSDLDEHFADAIRSETKVVWDRRDEVVQAVRQTRLFALVLEERKLDKVPPADLAAAMAEGVRQMGLECLPWSDELRKFRRRVSFLRINDPHGGWPDLSDQALVDNLEIWLVPYLTGITRRAHLHKLDLNAALRAMLDWRMSKRLDEMAPTHMAVPSGSRVPLDYDGEVPVLAVRLQEMFGCADTPRVADGQVALLLHLLSPARRPVQVTRDLASFWANAYHAVKADLKGQYPKHWWPDDPMQAEPTARVKPRR
ncbi:ATP-dependent helicase HrpB [Magnetospirillum sulfuroxidans]|uniref:ATP-dependent helicase HrpB n=1 Tax=Magnetospirillum sulfuroxidans TaxID=611300 RepID=A0ABS5IAU6_9PROT|nr:ATP-dependent helicase HrpB [Magnetospirillum sulfuroxidans]MBR9971386.1 ATP-dependent helicase HrpB [Magnetospirillum sulfuroxidans]